MTRSELIERLSRKFTNLSVPAIKLLIKEMFETMSLSLTRGDRIEIRGFGSFGVRLRRSRLARNPRTGEQVLTQGKQAPYFKAGKLLKEKVDKTSVAN
jgi:integration host factor subunit beta